MKYPKRKQKLKIPEEMYLFGKIPPNKVFGYSLNSEYLWLWTGRRQKTHPGHTKIDYKIQVVASTFHFDMKSDLILLSDNRKDLYAKHMYVATEEDAVKFINWRNKEDWATNDKYPRDYRLYEAGTRGAG